MSAGRVRPDHGGRCFDAIPGLVQHLLVERGRGKVAVLWLDAFGWRFCERHAGHPFLRRFADEGSLEPWTSQFPSTTTPHVATMHTGQPVAQHGLYEWFIYEPALDRMVCPLQFAFAGEEPGSLAAAGPALMAMLPAMQTVYQRLATAGVRSHTFQSSAYTPSPASAVALAGSQVHAFHTLEQGLAELAVTLAEPGPLYCFAYIDEIDSSGHMDGPDSPEFDGTVTRVLDLLEAWYADVAGAVGDAELLLIADHGQTAVDPATTMYVNRELEGIERLLRHGADGRPLAPGGSARDLFLHARPGAAADLAEQLRRMARERATVHLVPELVSGGLFGPEPSPRLLDRLGDVLVLPEPGESVWWWEEGRYEQRFRGHHGGLTADEMQIPLGRLELA